MDRIVIENATKTIKGRTILSNVSVTLDRGGIYGFFGINGSGKTMLFRAIAGLIRLTSGSICVFGQTIGKDASFPRSLGLVLSSGFWDGYSGFKNLKLLASIKGVAGEAEITRALERVGLDPADKQPYRNYSLGMKQRLEIAQAIMESPELLILDEPTNSLDASGLQMVLDLVDEQRAQGATVLLASHNVRELEALCDRRFKMEAGALSEKFGTEPNDGAATCAATRAAVCATVCESDLR